MSRWRFGIVGAGAVGSALGNALVRNGLSVEAVVSRTKSSAARLARRLGSLQYGTATQLLRSCNFILVTVPDAQIRRVARDMVAVPYLSETVVVGHTAGALTSGALTALERVPNTHMLTLSMHPLQTFTASGSREDLVTGITFALEGQRPSMEAAERTIRKIGAFSVRI